MALAKTQVTTLTATMAPQIVHSTLSGVGRPCRAATAGGGGLGGAAGAGEGAGSRRATDMLSGRSAYSGTSSP